MRFTRGFSAPLAPTMTTTYHVDQAKQTTKKCRDLEKKTSTPGVRAFKKKNLINEK